MKAIFLRKQKFRIALMSISALIISGAIFTFAIAVGTSEYDSSRPRQLIVELLRPLGRAPNVLLMANAATMLKQFMKKFLMRLQTLIILTIM